jgi:hypothetical protein
VLLSPRGTRALEGQRRSGGDPRFRRDIPDGLTVTKVTPRLVTYALPHENDWLVRGAAFYDTDGDAFYEEIRLTLPAADERLAEFLLKYFGDHTGLQ